MLDGLRNTEIIPDIDIYILIDDVDWLNERQVEVINTWISTRVSKKISIKLSTQIKKYKTYRTVSRHTIDSTHDYFNINISDIYTSSKSSYIKRLREIIKTRLEIANINASPEEFFVEDKKQEDEIKIIGEKLKEEWREEKRGYRPGDDAYRYARSEYIKSLGGSRKSRSNYLYAGFQQLGHISSGTARHFIEAAAVMYEDGVKIGKQKTIEYIPPNIQDTVICNKAESIMMNDFEKLKRGEARSDVANESVINNLRNLVEACGKTFFEILVSDRSERRVFSFAISDQENIDLDIEEVLKLGVQEGYFHESTIGTKEGVGRTRLYIMTRRLAPYYKLDPTSFAGYLFVTCEAIKKALQEGKYLKKIKDIDEVMQLTLFG